MLPRVENLLPQPRDSFESTNYFFPWSTTTTSTPTCDFETSFKGFKSSLNSLCSNWSDHQVLDMNFDLDKHTLSNLNLNSKFWSWFANTLQIEVLIHLVPKVLEPNKLPLWQSVINTHHKTEMLKVTNNPLKIKMPKNNST